MRFYIKVAKVENMNQEIIVDTSALITFFVKSESNHLALFYSGQIN